METLKPCFQIDAEPPVGRRPACSERKPSPSGILHGKNAGCMKFHSRRALRPLELPCCSVDMEQPRFQIDAEPPGGRRPACSERKPSPSGILHGKNAGCMKFHSRRALRPLELPCCSVDMEQPRFQIDAEPPGGRLCRISFACLIYPTYFMPLSSVLVQPSKNVSSQALKSSVRSA